MIRIFILLLIFFSKNRYITKFSIQVCILYIYYYKYLIYALISTDSHKHFVCV